MARGRKAAPLLYRADQVDMLGPVLASRLNAPNTSMEVAIDLLSNLNYEPRLPAPFRTPAAKIQNQLTRYAVADVVRRRWNRDLAITMRGKGFDGVTAAMVKAEGLLMIRLLNLVVATQAVTDGTPPPAIWWALVTLEGGATLRPRLYGEDEAWPKTKTEFIAAFKSITGDLMSYKNPFVMPYTTLLFDSAIEQALKETGRKADKDGFYVRDWQTYLEARADTVKFLKKKGTKMGEILT